MKKIIIGLVTACLSLTFSPTLSAKNTNNAVSKNTAEATAIVNRLHEIKTMDLSKLNADQKKELRKEVLDMKKQVMSDHPVVIISGGALLLIIILLIILL